MSELLAAANIVLAVVLILAAIFKVRSVSLFAENIANYQIVPYRLTRVAALAIICLELTVGCMLLLTRTRFIGSIFATVLFAAFLCALSIVLIRGKNIPCACFGSLSEKEPITLSSVFRTGSLLVLALLESVIGFGPSPLPLDIIIAALLMLLIFLSSQAVYLLTYIRQMNRRLSEALKNS
jgi:Methylamine utilisation protein MauE